MSCTHNIDPAFSWLLYLSGSQTALNTVTGNHLGCLCQGAKAARNPFLLNAHPVAPAVLV